MKKIFLGSTFLIALFSVSCATSDRNASYCVSISSSAKSQIADDIAKYLAIYWMPAKSAIWIHPEQTTPALSGFAFENALRAKGFAIANQGQSQKHELRYIIQQDELGISVILFLDNVKMSRFYRVEINKIYPVGAFSVFQS